MWIPSRDRLVKVRLHSEGEDPETPWAEDLGPDANRPGNQLVRIGNVPFLHAKPTYGDVISAAPDSSGHLAWDAAGRPYDEIVRDLIIEDGGRYAMIVDYTLSPSAGVDLAAAFQRLDRHGEIHDFAVEGCFANEETLTGRAYIAVPSHFSPGAALGSLRAGELPMTLELVHPRDDGTE